MSVQVSTDAADVLFETVVELATSPLASRRGAMGATPDEEAQRHFPPLLLDLCCGGGAIGLEVARAAATHDAPPTCLVVGIELSAAACEDARANAIANGLGADRYRVMCAKVEEALPEALRLLSGQQDGAVAVLDPPRTGVAPAVCKALRATAGIARVVFVSCNPHGHTLRHDYVVKGGSLAANARVLCGPKGRGTPFRLRSVVPVDMFVHTPHVELCLVFER